MKSLNEIKKGVVTGVDYRNTPQGAVAYSFNGIILHYEDGMLSWRSGETIKKIDSAYLYQTILAFCEIKGAVIALAKYMGYDIILKITPSDDLDAIALDQLYVGNDFNFTEIVTIKSYYESETIESIYWLDKTNGLNSINIRGDIAAEAPYSSHKSTYVYSNIIFKSYVPGELISGNYFYAYRSKSTDGRSVSPWSMINGPVTPYSEPIPAVWDVKTFDFSAYKILEPGAKTQTGVKLFIEKVDPSYDKIEVVAFYQSVDNEVSTGNIFFSEDINIDPSTGGMYVEHLTNNGAIIDVSDVLSPGITIIDGTDFELANKMNIVAGYTANSELPETDIIKKNKIKNINITVGEKLIPLYGSFNPETDYVFPNGITEVFPKKEPVYESKENHSITLNAFKNQQTNTNEEKVFEIDNDFPNYRGGLMSSMMKYFKSGESYRIGILPIDNYGNKLGVRWADDIQIPISQILKTGSIYGTPKEYHSKTIPETLIIDSTINLDYNNPTNTLLEWNSFPFPYPLRKTVVTPTVSNAVINSNLFASHIDSLNYYDEESKPEWYTDFIANSSVINPDIVEGKIKTLILNNIDITDLVITDGNGNPTSSLIQGFHVVVANRDRLYEDDVILEPLWKQEEFQNKTSANFNVDFNFGHKVREKYIKYPYSNQFSSAGGEENLIALFNIDSEDINYENENIAIKRNHKILYKAQSVTQSGGVIGGFDSYIHDKTAKYGITSLETLKMIGPENIPLARAIESTPYFAGTDNGIGLYFAHTIANAHSNFGFYRSLLSVYGTTLWNIFCLDKTPIDINTVLVKESKYVEELNYADSYEDQGVYIDSAGRKINNAAFGLRENDQSDLSHLNSIGIYFAKAPGCHIVAIDEDISSLYPEWGRGDIVFTGAIKNNKVIFYGGTSDEALALTEYRSTWHYQKVDLTVLAKIKKSTTSGIKFIFDNVEVLGGDTVLSLYNFHKEKRAVLSYQEGKTEDFGWETSKYMPNDFTHTDGPYYELPAYMMAVPIESSRNFSQVITGDIKDKKDYTAYYDPSGNWTNGNNGIGETFRKLSNDDIPYISKENRRYNKYLLKADNIALSYYGLASFIDITNKYPNRFIWSDFKYSSEPYDSFKSFDPLNYLEIEGNGGTITKIAAKNQRLYFWQQKAVGYTSIKERSYVTDSSGEKIGVGTSESFKEYYIPITGIGLQNSAHFIQTRNGFSWYDHLNEAWYFMTDGMELFDIFKDTANYPLKEQFLNDYDFSDSTTNELHIGFDPASDLLILSIFSTANNDVSILFNIKAKQIVGVLSKSMKKSFIFKDKLFGHPISGPDEDSFIRFAVNDKLEMYKTFDNIEVILRSGSIKAVRYHNDEFDITEEVNEFYTMRKNKFIGSTPFSSDGARIKGDYLCIDLIVDKDAETKTIISSLYTEYREDWS